MARRSRRPCPYEGVDKSIKPTTSCNDGTKDFGPKSCLYGNNFSPALLWQCVKGDNVYLRKSGTFQMSCDPLNSSGLHNEKHCGFIHRRPTALKVKRKGSIALNFKTACSVHKQRRPRAMVGSIKLPRGQLKEGKKTKAIQAVVTDFNLQQFNKKLCKLSKTAAYVKEVTAA